MKGRALLVATFAFFALVVTPGSAVSLARHSEIIHEYRNTPTGCRHSTAPSADDKPQAARDGSHDFDFNLGRWHTHIRRLTAPLSGSNNWIDLTGAVAIRPLWNGKAQLEEIEADGPKGHWEGLTVFLYNPAAHQWSLNFANSREGTVAVPSIGSFNSAPLEVTAASSASTEKPRGQFYAGDSFNGRAILSRQIWSDITPDSHRFEQSFSDDGGKTWEVNFVADLTRDTTATSADAAASTNANAAPDASHDFDFAFGTWKEKTSRMLHPLTGSTEWIEMDGQSVTRPFWKGRGNFTELQSAGPSGHLELLALRLYDPTAKQWNLLFATSGVGVLGLPPTIGSFTKDGTRGDFYDQETYNGRAILLRFTFLNQGANSARSEQAFSSDGGRTWETNWINNYTRIPNAAATSASVAHN